jgi:nicotinamide-nucleotide amidase
LSILETALMLPEDVLEAAARLVMSLTAADLKLATAESCTGGLVAAAITDVPGSSAVLDRGFVTYSNEAKVALLGVDPGLIALHGAVSGPVAMAMAEGALHHSLADIAVSVTGVAGPGGGNELKPVGLVHFAVARRGRATVDAMSRFGDIGRRQVRVAAVQEALRLLGDSCGQ